MGEGRLSVKAGRKGARASSCFDRKPSAFYTYSFQITAPTSEVPNTVMDKHTDIFFHTTSARTCCQLINKIVLLGRRDVHQI